MSTDTPVPAVPDDAALAALIAEVSNIYDQRAERRLPVDRRRELNLRLAMFVPDLLNIVRALQAERVTARQRVLAEAVTALEARRTELQQRMFDGGYETWDIAEKAGVEWAQDTLRALAAEPPDGA